MMIEDQTTDELCRQESKMPNAELFAVAANCRQLPVRNN